MDRVSAGAIPRRRPHSSDKNASTTCEEVSPESIAETTNPAFAGLSERELGQCISTSRLCQQVLPRREMGLSGQRLGYVKAGQYASTTDRKRKMAPFGIEPKLRASKARYQARWKGRQSQRWESNPRPIPYERNALPLSYAGVPSEGFEPTCLPGKSRMLNPL